MAKRIVLGMSGGVDSSVSVVLLQRAGWEVVGVTCVFAAETPAEQATAEAAARDAAEVARALGVEHHVYDCRDVFVANVVEPFCAAYAAGLTPSPCVTCNRTTKLPSLLRAAEELGAEAIATGHYARVVRLNGRPVLMRALDDSKDQSYMLAQVPTEILDKLVLPLGGMTKVDVRLLAEDLGLPVAHRADSQDICFAPKGYREVLRAHGVAGTPGEIVTTDGRVVGTHAGLEQYTAGQRSGLGIGGAPEPYYVLGKDAAANRLTVGFAAEAVIGAVDVNHVVWQAFEGMPDKVEAMVKLRYRSFPAACVVERLTGEADASGNVACTAATDASGAVATGAAEYRVRLLSPQTVTAAGQAAVFYQGDTVLGSGIISGVLPVKYLADGE